MAIVIIDQAAHRDAPAWYRSGRSEPSGDGLSLSVDVVVPLSQITMAAVLTEIANRAAPGGDVILVCHARDLGLAIPLIPGGPRARSEAIGLLASDHASNGGGIPLPAVTPEDAAQQLTITPTDVIGLRSSMNSVRAKGLRHVALRGCNVGAWANALATFRDFFGCVQSLSGPNLRDTYGSANAGAPAPDLTRWTAQHRGWHTFFDGTQGNQVGIATQGGDTDEHAYQMAFAYQSAPGLQHWGTRHLGAPVSPQFYYHGMWLTSAQPGSPRIFFIGDSDYAQHLQVV